MRLSPNKFNLEQNYRKFGFSNKWYKFMTREKISEILEGQIAGPSVQYGHHYTAEYLHSQDDQTKNINDGFPFFAEALFD